MRHKTMMFSALSHLSLSRPLFVPHENTTTQPSPQRQASTWDHPKYMYLQTVFKLYSMSQTMLHTFWHSLESIPVDGRSSNFNQLQLYTLCVVCPSHFGIPATVAEKFDSEWRGVWTWRAGALLFPYCCFPEYGQLHPTTLNIFSCHHAIFCQRATYCTSYERGGQDLSYEFNCFDM